MIDRRSNPRDAEVLYVHGVDLVAPGLFGGPASMINYDVVVRTDAGDQIAYGVKPSNRRYPDTVDTIAAVSGDPVGLIWRANTMLFIIPEMVRITEQC